MSRFFNYLVLLGLFAFVGCIGETGSDGIEPVDGITEEIDVSVALTPITVDSNSPDSPPITDEGGIVTEITSEQPSGSASDNAAIPTSTPEPLAASVNGAPITLVEFQRELTRYEDALRAIGQEPGAGGIDYHTLILDQLIEQALIRETAVSNNISVSSEEASIRMDELRATAGGNEGFQNWLAQNQFEEFEFFEALRTEMLTERVVSFITADVPSTVEMVRARYIQVNDETLANEILARLAEGGDFAEEARQFSLDRTTGDSGGDLGFFARNTLFVSAVEDAAFALELEQLSSVITVQNDGAETRYYIVQPLEYDPARPLTATERSPMLQQQFEAWLADQKASADIQRFINS